MCLSKKQSPLIGNHQSQPVMSDASWVVLLLIASIWGTDWEGHPRVLLVLLFLLAGIPTLHVFNSGSILGFIFMRTVCWGTSPPEKVSSDIVTFVCCANVLFRKKKKKEEEVDEQDEEEKEERTKQNTQLYQGHWRRSKFEWTGTIIWRDKRRLVGIQSDAAAAGWDHCLQMKSDLTGQINGRVRRYTVKEAPSGRLSSLETLYTR